MAFRPHGFIQLPIQQVLYNDARNVNNSTEIANPKENETVALLQNILYQNIFSGDIYAVASQQPLVPGSSKTCHIVVYYLDSETISIRVLCFAGYKRDRTSQTFSLRALEAQAHEDCQFYLDHHQHVENVFAITSVCTRVRLWKLARGHNDLNPFWGSNNGGDSWNEYKDLGGDVTELEKYFNLMKGLPEAVNKDIQP